MSHCNQSKVPGGRQRMRCCHQSSKFTTRILAKHKHLDKQTVTGLTH